MTEIVYSPPPAWSRHRTLRHAGLAAGTALIAAGVVMLRAVPPASPPAAPVIRRTAPAVPLHPPRRLERTAAPEQAAAALGARAARAFAALDRPAALGLDRGLFTSSPGGIFATAARVAQWRPLVVRAAHRRRVDPNLLEAIVLVESSGRPNAIAAGDAAGPSGLTQLDAATARRLHLRVHLYASRLLTRSIRLATVRGEWGRAARLRARRRAADPRFAPARSLAATAAFLSRAGRALGRADLAVASYRLGLGDLDRAVHRFARAAAAVPARELVRADGISYAALYFGSAPDRRAGIWRELGERGVAARDYCWKVLAAERAMRLWRDDRSALAFEARQQLRKSSAEEFLHPLGSTYRFPAPGMLARAWRHHVLRAIPRDAARTHVAVGASLGQMARRLGRSRRLYRGLRPDALAVLLYLGRRVHELSGARRPLIVTSAVRDLRYQRVLADHNPMAARTYSLHTTGYAFDVARSYGSSRQAAAFAFVLDRLSALRLIAYIREPAAIHVAVAGGAAARLRVLERVGAA